MDIAGRRVGPDEPVYLVAELSANHRQRYEEAEKLVRAAQEVGADAVKLQTYTPDTITIDSDEDMFRQGPGSLWEGKTLYELYEEAYMPWDWQPKLKDLAEDLGIDLFSAAFDPTAVDFLEEMGVPAYKVASFEIVDIPLIERIARTGKPVILSTGTASRPEIDEAVAAVEAAGARQVALLKCTSAYPTPPDEMNLRAIRQWADDYGIPIGLSDHSLSLETPVAAVALGASLVEKHFTLSRDHPSLDAAFSLEPEEFHAMVTAVRQTEQALGRAEYEVGKEEAPSLAFRRSLFVVREVKAGEAFTEANLRSIRPGNGLHPRHLKEILGRKAVNDVARGTPMAWELVA